ncbi:hypothetical protein A2U01_0097711, partial [Trifolium medium]|nr:hypothetical protein [Trifolium medium]
VLARCAASGARWADTSAVRALRRHSCVLRRGQQT